MRPFFSYFGSKWSSAPKYPQPKPGQLVIEPFAGAAGFSTRIQAREVLLIERDPTVAALWRFLLNATPDDVLGLPDLEPGQKVRDLGLPAGPSALIGFWCNKGTTRPRQTLSAWASLPRGARQFWGEAVRRRIAGQLHRLDGWTLIEGDYSAAPDVDAFWFIDPPYIDQGRHYRHGSDALDFAGLARFAQSRRGQVVCCEQAGAQWLPFRPFATVKATTRKGGEGHTSEEVIWTKGIVPAQLSLLEVG